MKRFFFHCYETAYGTCGIAWSEPGGICGSQLPEESAAATRDRMRVRFPSAVESATELPPAVRVAIEGVRALLSGEVRDLLEIELDESGVPEFNRKVHALTRQIPVGQTRTYGELALALGLPGAARAVGQAEGSNPFAPIVPCHRVMGSGGVGTGFSAHGGVQTKLKLLTMEARATGQQAAEQSSLF
ncbi:methylated-DNA--[protein]-cysteine S-methyltransferase [Pelomonas sp. V22]|uniref:methylated-DNA--[protein]-cysteine S-methyltransferase n=1 Tax=Pelomonas sp. V22 TaxID=2822139 RepID=UPI0024A9E073|nr:methylated-DNA--[protein]-cysteine S-methyltransferase [Pelomonas sp. V22]MDI4633428.1 methylated-DNA--[protein]-cysteine S-methyltransferase [Pelomonas sp. V22]